MQTDKRRYDLWLVAAITLITYFIFIHTPYTGDDLVYVGLFGGVSPDCESILQWPRWCGSHWLTNNGRMANYLMPVLGLLPHSVVALVCAAMLGLMYRVSLALTESVNRMVNILFVAAVTFVLPWWDSMFIFDCQLNYVWASALSLASVWIILKIEPDQPVWFVILSALICFAGGMMHEAASMPLCVGLAVYMLMNRRTVTRTRVWLAGAFAVGMCMALISPGIIMRAASSAEPDDTWYWLLVKSTAVAAVLWLSLGVMCLSRIGRERVGSLLRSSLGIFAIAALVGIPVSVGSGIVGRSGWFAELAAMIVIFGWLGRRIRVSNVVVNIVVSLVTVAQLCGVLYWQVKLSREFSEFEQRYADSEDGTVYLDYTRDDQLPVWALGRLRGVLDPDDAWLLGCHADFYRKDAAWPVVLPEDARSYVPLTADSVSLANGDMLVRELPADAYPYLLTREDLTIMLCRVDGEPWVAQPIASGGWHLSPRMIDPGDR